MQPLVQESTGINFEQNGDHHFTCPFPELRYVLGLIISGTFTDPVQVVCASCWPHIACSALFRRKLTEPDVSSILSSLKSGGSTIGFLLFPFLVCPVEPYRPIRPRDTWIVSGRILGSNKSASNSVGPSW